MHNIKTKAGRGRLDERKEPYWSSLRKTRSVGWRAGADTWHAKMFHNGKEIIKPLPEALDYEQAVDHAEAWFAEMVGGAAKTYTVDTLITEYVAHLRIENGEDSAHRSELALNRYVLPRFKGRQVSSITTDEFNKWRLSFLPAVPTDEEAMRKAKATSNRHWNSLRAALSLAFSGGLVAEDRPWRRVAPFEKVEKARDFYPTPSQVADLIKHCADDFRPLARALALTGYRLQALSEATVADFDADQGTLQIRDDKGHTREATLSTQAIGLFKLQSKDKLPPARLFLRADGKAWGKSHQHRPFRDACDKAKLPRQFILYSLRHYFISRALRAGMSVNALAKNVGTSAAMIEKHYAKFIRTDVREMLDRMEVA